MVGIKDTSLTIRVVLLFLLVDENSDYIPLTESLIDEFNDDNRRSCFEVSIQEDDAFEYVEQFQVILSRRSGGQVVVNPDIAIVRIIDTDRKSLITFAPIIFNLNYIFTWTQVSVLALI